MPPKLEYEDKIEDEKRQGRIDYANTAFMLRRPYSNLTIKGPYRLKDSKQHSELLERAKKQQLYIWYGHFNVDDNKEIKITEPHLLDWSSVPDNPYGAVVEQRGITKDYLKDEPTKEYPDDLKCPKCNKQMSSRPGYTLHLKMHENEKIEEPIDLKCDVCGKQCSSTSGLTLHKKYHHER